jgi:hypothetical protein
MSPSPNLDPRKGSRDQIKLAEIREREHNTHIDLRERCVMTTIYVCSHLRGTGATLLPLMPSSATRRLRALSSRPPRSTAQAATFHTPALQPCRPHCPSTSAITAAPQQSATGVGADRGWQGISVASCAQRVEMEVSREAMRGAEVCGSVGGFCRR